MYLDLTPAFNTEHQNPSVWTLFGESYRVGYIFYIKYIVQPSNPPLMVMVLYVRCMLESDIVDMALAYKSSM